MSRKIIILSGGFDPIHSGHIAMFEESRDLGDIVVHILQNGCQMSHGSHFQPQVSRG